MPRKLAAVMMHGADGGGSHGWHALTHLWPLALLVVAALALAVLALVLLQRSRRELLARSAATVPVPVPAFPAPVAAPPAPVAEGRRFLDEDERRVLDLVVARDGDVPQGDLVGLTGYSKAKVSRVLDRLERKRLVVRVRRGMGNRVLLVPHEDDRAA